jgi:hypothetical protein
VNHIEKLRALMLERTGGQYAGQSQTHDTQTRATTIDDNTVAEPVRRDAATPAPRAETIETQRPQVETPQTGTLERITERFGRPVAFDGRLCLWTSRDNDRTRDSHDIRNVAAMLRVDVDVVLMCLPEFAPVVRGKRSLSDAVEESA